MTVENMSESRRRRWDEQGSSKGGSHRDEYDSRSSRTHSSSSSHPHASYDRSRRDRSRSPPRDNHRRRSRSPGGHADTRREDRYRDRRGHDDHEESRRSSRWDSGGPSSSKFDQPPRASCFDQPPPSRDSQSSRDKEEDGDPVAAAAAAAAARIREESQFRLGVVPSSTADMTVYKPDPMEEGLFVKDIEVNDVKNRYALTKGATQSHIKEEFGVDVTTRGRYYPDRTMATPENPPLYLHVVAATEEALKKALEHIDGLINQTVQPIVMPPREYVRREVLSRKIMIEGLQNERGFNIRSRIVGPGGAYVKHIQNETNSRITLKGVGAGSYNDFNTAEPHEPLHILITNMDETQLEEGVKLLNDLIETVKKDYAAIKSANSRPLAGPGMPPAYGAMPMQNYYPMASYPPYGAMPPPPPPPPTQGSDAADAVPPPPPPPSDGAALSSAPTSAPPPPPPATDASAPANTMPPGYDATTWAAYQQYYAHYYPQMAAQYGMTAPPQQPGAAPGAAPTTYPGYHASPPPPPPTS